MGYTVVKTIYSACLMVVLTRRLSRCQLKFSCWLNVDALDITSCSYLAASNHLPIATPVLHE
eukprot:820941-Amphidinium_carterae.1